MNSEQCRSRRSSRLAAAEIKRPAIYPSRDWLVNFDTAEEVWALPVYLRWLGRGSSLTSEALLALHVEFRKSVRVFEDVART